MGYRAILICICTIFLTGCWDNVEIQERGYILGITIDKAPILPKGFEKEEDYKSERDIEKVPLQQESPEYVYTIQLPIVALTKNRPAGTGGGGGGEPGKSTWNLTMMGNSFMEVNRILHTRLDYPAYYEHLQVIVISEEVAKEGISKVLDLFLRDHEMRRRTKIFITSKEAKKILDITPRIEDYPSLYLADLPQNAERTSRILNLTDLGRVSESLHTKTDFILPRVEATKDELRVAGAAIFKGEKMMGWIGEIDTIFTQFVRDSVEGGVIIIKDPKNPKALITLEITKASTKVRPKVEDEKIKMKIDVKVNFNLAEKFEVHFSNALNDEYLKSLESAAEKYIKDQIQDTIKYVQKEFGADIFHFNVQMKRYEPHLWKQVEADWEDIFRKLEVDIEVKAKVKEVGTMM